jgi:hypothetical protein
MTNLAASDEPQHKKIRQRLETKILAEMKKLNDPALK